MQKVLKFKYLKIYWGGHRFIIRNPRQANCESVGLPETRYFFQVAFNCHRALKVILFSALISVPNKVGIIFVWHYNYSKYVGTGRSDAKDILKHHVILALLVIAVHDNFPFLQDYSSADCGTRLHHYPYPQCTDVGNMTSVGTIHDWSQVHPQDVDTFSSPDTSYLVFQQGQHQNHQLPQDQVTPRGVSVQHRILDPLCNPSPNQLLQHSGHYHQSHTSSPHDRCLYTEQNQLDSQLQVGGSVGSAQQSPALTSAPPLATPLLSDVRMKLCGFGDMQNVPQVDSIPSVSHKSTSSKSDEVHTQNVCTSCYFSLSLSLSQSKSKSKSKSKSLNICKGLIEAP